MTNTDRGREHNFEERKKTVEEAEQNIIGNAYRGLISRVNNYASTEGEGAKKTHILFVGETGTGKELFADLYIAVNPRVGKICKANWPSIPTP